VVRAVVGCLGEVMQVGSLFWSVSCACDREPGRHGFTACA
jgi:hypothetical protein